MHITELDSFKLSDAVKFHNRLNPKIWGRDEHLLPEVREKLTAIADNFREFLGVGNLDVRDITISGSNAAYSYTPYSDIDLHLVVEFPADDEVYQELFNAKKYQYNDEHTLSIGGVPVELYVQNAAESPVSQGEYSIPREEWIQVPRRKRARIDDTCVRAKVEDLDARIHSAIQSGNVEHMSRLWDKIKAMRQSGLDAHGEFGCENIVFKILRNKGCIKDLRTARTAAQDHELSLKEQDHAPQFHWGFAEGHQGQPYSSPDGVAPSTQMFLNESDIDSVLSRFFKNCIDFLEIENAPEMVLHHDTDWSEKTGSFGQYDPDDNVLHLATSGRHILDILRTMAHEVTHCKQNENHTLPPNAGETGSWWEDEANAMAGRIMRYFADEHPEMFKDVSLEQRAPDMNQSMQESSGYIPTKAQANDPRFKMALTVDVQPGQTGKEANKMKLATDAQGRPQVLRADGKVKLAESLAKEFELFEEQDLFEINMGSKNLRKEAAKTGAIAGMEFEMIVPNVEGGDDDGQQEPDYEYDEGVSSIQDAYDFFYDGDYNGRSDCERLRDKMTNEYNEWLSESFDTRWDGDESEFVYNYLKENASADEIAEILGVELGEDGEYVADKQAYRDATEKVIEESYGNYWYDAARESAQEDFNQNADLESEWLEDRGLNRMSDIENEYNMSWPHWQSVGGGEASIEDVANEFQDAIGRDVRSSGNYHSVGVKRPSPTAQHYLVEPDGSLEADDSNDVGLEFVSPPLPIDDILSDLNKVKAWAKQYGCYTNDSTGLHINISVPDYSRKNLDFVKLALLMGDEYVLDLFGRAGNTYTQSAMKLVRNRVRQNPDEAQNLLDKMKGNLDGLASKAIHSGITEKRTSINTKDGHIEFRSPGGDWLDQNFDQIENTLLRFTVAMSAALNPDMYREEYLKKLYKLLTQDQKGDDTIKYFSEYVAGKIPAAALRSFVKQARLERSLKKGNTEGKKYWWRVGRPGFGASVEVVATSKEEAIEKGRAEYPDWATAKDMTAKPLRPYEESQQTFVWKVTGSSNSPYQSQGIEVVASTEFEAMQKARKEWNLNVGGRTEEEFFSTNGWSAVPVRKAPAVQDTGSATSGNWGVWVAMLDRYAEMNVDGQSVTRRFTDQAAAQDWIQDYNTRQPGNGLALVAQEIEPSEPRDTSQFGAARGAPNWEIRRNSDQEVVHRFSADNQNAAMIQATDFMNTQGWSNDDYTIQSANSQTNVNPLRPTGPGPWEVANRNNNQVYYNPEFTNRGAAESEARTWLSQNGHNPNDFEVRTREGSRSDAEQSGIIDIEPDLEFANPIQYEIFNNDTGQIAVAFLAPDDSAAIQRLLQYRETHGDADYRTRRSAVAGSTAALAQQRATPGTFSGAWKVLVNGEEVHRFSGVGNNQSDANRVAATWLRNNGRGVSGEGFEVYPIMTEGLAEGKDRYGNFDPPGPETPPTMPAGTVRVDVSDVYDWYKLGQHISNMKGLGKHDFGKGPPSAIISFGDEDLEHQYIQALKQTGLTTTDIDPVDPNQPAGMPRQKTDPTYNVNEADASDYELHDRPKLDQVLAKCCRMVVQGQQRDPKRYGQVAACVIDPDNRMIYGINLPAKDGTRRHAERVAIDKYRKSIGEIPAGSIVVTTCSPCNSPMEERHGESCKDLLNSVGIHKVYAGYQDPTQHDDSDADFRVYVTENDQLWGECQLFAQTFLGSEELPENFADGKNPQDKGDSKRYGVPTKASVSTLRKVAKQGGRKGQLAHWMANMKAGKAKAKRK